ncbi:ATP-binding protein [Flindersiella endophytica]
MEQGNAGRPRPLSADSVSAFVRQLRSVKAWAGNPSLAHLSRLTGFPRSTLSDALSPKRTHLPALDLVQQLVRACGCTESEVTEWVSAWRAIQTASDVRTESQEHAAAVVPRQLPAAPSRFVGRAGELRRLDELAPPGRAGTNLTIAAITGKAGIGKTALALHWAQQAADRFSDGQIYLDLRGFSPGADPVAPAEAIRYFLDTLEVPPERIPPTVEAQSALFRTLVASRRLLILLDNAVDLAQVEPLLPGGSAGFVLATSRNRLTSLVAKHGAQAITLDVLADGDAGRLLAGGTDPALLTTEPSAVRQLIDYCDRLPLALTIVGARASAEPAWPLSRLATELADERSRLDVLETDDPDTNVRAAFASSYRALDAECQGVFRLLGVHPGPDISVPALASMTGRTPVDVRRSLDELVLTHLVEESAPGRFILHDLLRTYATELANAHDAEVEGCLRRLFDHYLRTACTASRLLHPGRESIALAPSAGGVIPETLIDHEQAAAWFAAERRVLLAIIDRAAAGGFGEYAWQLAWSVANYLDVQGRWDDLRASHEVALTAATRLNRRIGQVHAHAGIAVAHARRNRFSLAAGHLRRALDLCEQVDDDVAEAHLHYILSWVYASQDHHGDALHQAERALELFQALGNRSMQARALNAIGCDHAMLGDDRQTLAYCQQALAMLRELGDRSGEAATLDSLGCAHRRLGNHQQSVECCRTAAELAHEQGSRLPRAITLDHLGDAHHSAGDDTAAGTAWRRALQLFEELDHADAAQVRAKLAGLGQA